MIVKVLEKATAVIENGQVIKGIINNGVDYASISGANLEKYELLEVLTPEPLPTFDSRIFIQVIKTNVIGEIGANGLRTITNVYSLERRPIEQLIQAVTDAETLANDTITKTDKNALLALNCISQNLSNLSTTGREKSALAKLNGISVKINKNAENADLLIEAFKKGLNPDIDLGWEKE